MHEDMKNFDKSIRELDVKNNEAEIDLENLNLENDQLDESCHTLHKEYERLTELKDEC
jgi:hypothetical protein